MKSFRVYTLIDPFQRQRFLDEALLADVLPNIVSADPGPHTWQTLGVVPPSPTGEQLYHRPTHSTIMLSFRLCERILPSSVISDLVDKRIRELLEEEGDDRKTATKKERAQVKHEVVEAELPTAKVKSKYVPVIIRGEYVIVGATTAKLCEDILSKLRAALGSLKAVPLAVQSEVPSILHVLARYPGSKMKEEQATAEDHVGYAFDAGTSGALLDADGSKTSFTHTPTNCEHIVDALDGDYTVVELQVFAYSDHGEDAHPDATFKVNKGLTFKAFKLAQGLIDAAMAESREFDDDEADLAAMARFDANAIIGAETVTGILDSFIALAGGRVIGTEEEKLLEEQEEGRKSVIDRPAAGEYSLDDLDNDLTAAAEDEDEDDYFADL